MAKKQKTVAHFDNNCYVLAKKKLKVYKQKCWEPQDFKEIECTFLNDGPFSNVGLLASSSANNGGVCPALLPCSTFLTNSRDFALGTAALPWSATFGQACQA